MEKKLYDESLSQPYPTNIDWIGALNYAFAQSSVPFIGNLSLINNTLEDLSNIKITIDFSFDFIENYEKDIEIIKSATVFEIVPELKISAKKLFEITESIFDKMKIKIVSADETIFETEYEFPVFPMNQWSGSTIFPESIATFVTPNIPQVTALQKRVSQILKAKTDDSAITGYLMNDKNRVREIMAAIYATICEEKISYALHPASFTSVGQIVRNPQDVLEQKMGTCIEMAVLYCALAEACGLNPFLVIIKGHAFAGTWLSDFLFDENIIVDESEIQKRLAAGINDIEVFECTYMNEGHGKDFEQAVKMGRENVSKDFDMVVDIRRSHYFGLRPMPVRLVENGNVRLIDYGIHDDESDLARVDKLGDDYFLDTTKDEKKTKSDIWLKNLLDLSKRNALVSFKPGPKNMQIFNSNLSKLEDALSDGDTFEIREVVSDWNGTKNKIQLTDIETQGDFIDKISDAEFKAKRLRTFIEKEELEKTLKTIYRDSKVSIEESGSSSLFLAMGFLQWFDPKETDVDGNRVNRYAPIVLVPVEIIRSSNSKYSLRLRDEDSQMNITLLEMLRQKFNLNITGLNPLPEDESGIDLPLVFNSMRKAIMDMKGWDILEISFLANFSFSQFVMWNDLKNRFDRLKENKVVKAFVDGRYKDYLEESIKEKDIDSKVSVKDLVIPSNIDSSQLVAVLEAMEGSSFVLHGPPGTGKSQTITNMIANALYQGKSVLFVAEKMAALNVVNERLSKIGLGDFCLEVHSNKIQKSVVLEKFRNNLELTESEPSDLFDRKTTQIQFIKDELNSQILDLHRKQNLGISIYELIDKIKSYDVNLTDVDFELDSLSTLNVESWDTLQQTIGRLDYIVDKSEYEMYSHPLRDFKISQYSKELEQILQKNLQDISSDLAKLNSISSNGNIDLESLSFINNVMSELDSNISINETLWNNLSDGNVTNNINMLESFYDMYSPIKKDIYSKYSKEVDNFTITDTKRDYIEASNKFLFKASKMKKSLYGLNAICINSHSVDEGNFEQCFNEVANWQNKLRELSEVKGKIDRDLLSVIEGYVDEQNAIEDIRKICDVVEYLSSKGYDYNSGMALINLSKSNDAVDIINTYKDAVENMSKINTEYGTKLPNKIDGGNISSISEKISLWNSNIPLFKEWASIYEYIEIIKSLGFTASIDKLYSIEEKVNIKDVFMKGLYSSLAQLYIGQSTHLNKFFGNITSEKILEYNNLLDEYEKLSQDEVRRKLLSNVPSVVNCSDEEAREIANIKRAIQSKGRGISIRQIFQENSNVIKKLTPCLLMSPLSVAQYIDLSFPKFDLVIFDEASQIQTGVAIGAMSRANDCIIVGDPNQMPPTSFFSSSSIDENNIQVEDLESLLEDCLAVNMPEIHLKCHYRSQSESLIAFSNRLYYGNNMTTFPSPYDINSKVSLRMVNGVYDRGVSRTNKEEAEAIVQEIVSRVKSNPNDSIGVVTFNQSQQNLIDDLLQKELNKDKELEAIVNGMYEPIFIKNLENVQGDERDVILFSITFGKDSNGKFYQNFGPIAKKGGWRRLNVAVSRSRKEMVVFASIGFEEITLSSNSSEGVRGIKKFLEYAQKGMSSIAKTNSDVETDNVINSIVGFIEKSGYDCDINIGSSKFTLSIGVVSPTDKNKYIATILVDDKSYFETATMRDRNRLIPQVLGMRGWNMYRIWTLDWFDNQAKEEEKLIEFLKSVEK